ncbi:MerR family transcriptional regulator [Streptomyces dioscori]|uniref:MerR family transcriptional regulator n=1 Tax=Streptomyces dioscori TaxID=2109333 RepID=A0A2P8PWP9_9ACTN|nr:MerR family transcriptional regulator [Streptomyces dioscori]
MVVPTLPIDDENAALYTIGQVADMLGVQLAFLRRLDERSVIVPVRSAGGQRRYTRREIGLVTEALALIEEGVTLAGVRHVLTLRHRVAQLESDLAELRQERRLDSGRVGRG